MTEIVMTNINELHGWERNPRQCDPERLELLKLSLRKFGFVLPLYANKDGLIYSGHQRTTASKLLGWEQAPVVYCTGVTLSMERKLNIVFNLCTNDHATKGDMGVASKQSLKQSGVTELVTALPDTANPYPCLEQVKITPVDYMSDQSVMGASPMTYYYAQALLNLGITMPVVLASDGRRVLNGKARLLAAIKLGLTEYPAVIVKEHEEELEKLVNKITMSFDLKKAYGEELRFNSKFLKISQRIHRRGLGSGFIQWAFTPQWFKENPEEKMSMKVWRQTRAAKLEGKYLQRWMEEYGTRVIDFGAGRLDNTKILNDSGIDCLAFEPFLPHPDKDELSATGARMLARTFLNRIGNPNYEFDSLFCNCVFNSVPFKEDRDFLMHIFQALCCKGARLYLNALPRSSFDSVMFSNHQNATEQKTYQVLLDIEPGLFIYDPLHNEPRVQKYHTKEELLHLGNTHFHKVRYGASIGHAIKCEGAKPIDPVMLAKALAFEFNLGYPGGERMGLVDQALDAFSTFTGIDLNAYRTEAETV